MKKYIFALLMLLSAAPIKPFCGIYDSFLTNNYVIGALIGGVSLATGYLACHVHNQINLFYGLNAKLSQNLHLTDLFLLKDEQERFNSLTEYFTNNPHLINSHCTYPYSFKAPARQPLTTSTIVGDYQLTCWFLEHGADVEALNINSLNDTHELYNQYTHCTYDKLVEYATANGHTIACKKLEILKISTAE